MGRNVERKGQNGGIYGGGKRANFLNLGWDSLRRMLMSSFVVGHVSIDEWDNVED